MDNVTNMSGMKKFKDAERYVNWLDKHVGRKIGYVTGSIQLHYKFNFTRYESVAYYTAPESKEIFFYTPQEYKFIGTSHTVEDTYSFLHRLLQGEFANNYELDY